MRVASVSNLCCVFFWFALLFKVVLSAEDLTPEEFDDIFSKKDVFLKLYAPWCGHCKQLAPIWDQLMAIFEGEDSVAVAKIDATKHDAFAKKLDVEGFPTLVYFRHKHEDRAKYNGGRTLDDLVSFVNGKAGLRRMSEGVFEGRISKLNSLLENVPCEGYCRKELHNVVTGFDTSTLTETEKEMYKHYDEALSQENFKPWSRARKTKLKNQINDRRVPKDEVNGYKSQTAMIDYLSKLVFADRMEL